MHVGTAAAQLPPELLKGGRVGYVAWQPEGNVERWVVSLHGTRGDAQQDLEIWKRNLGRRRLGLVAIQWWLEDGERYLPPEDIYREIDAAARQLGIRPGSALLHGFSRGAANLYALAAIDQGRGRRLFSLYVASSGGVALDYPPTRALLEGRYGARPLAGTRWVTACGGRDEHPERDGCPGMRRTAQWLQAQGALLASAIEDPNAGHGALQLNPGNAARLLDLFLR